MTRWELDVSADTDADVVAAMAWYEQQRPGLGMTFLAAFERGLEQIAQRPLSFPAVPAVPEVRQARLARFPYRLMFQVLSDRVRVVACVHERRHPLAWTKRVRRDDE